NFRILIRRREACLGTVESRQSDVAGELIVSLICDRPRRGVPRVTDDHHDQYLRTSALRHGLANATQLQARLPDVRGTRVSRQTIHNNTVMNVCSGQQDHVTWTMRQWSTLWFKSRRGAFCVFLRGFSLSLNCFRWECEWACFLSPCDPTVGCRTVQGVHHLLH
uniref:Transposase Tc1-like domain-containing protein n=1 Tax=Oryzias latipes TaxID=8090 RepID=A0A3B3I7U6_ORYLA